MTLYIIFGVSLVLTAILVASKHLELANGRNYFLSNILSKLDRPLLGSWFKLKVWWSHVNFKNLRLIFSWIMVKIKRLMIVIKRRLDHQQSHFFTQKKRDASKNKGSISFFLKDVSEYKQTLREKEGEKVE